jgi:hypothetical protein
MLYYSDTFPITFAFLSVLISASISMMNIKSYLKD